MVDPAPPSDVVLVIPDEPEALRADLRQAVLGGQAWADLPEDLDLATWLWDRWQPTLEPAGLDRRRFAGMVAASRREQWLWVLGDRQWSQFADGLAGRVLRRLPSAEATGA
jgi:hypothetical protein